MCVILACPDNVRPNAQTLRNCERANPHGAGVAWREDGEVWWMKGLDADELADLIERIEGEIVMHFRWASVGEVTPKLCHPFPVTPCATTRLTGRARAVLFHNGTWTGWRDALARMPRHRITDKLVSDSRVAASLVDHLGPQVLNRLPGKYALFDRDGTELFGDWREWGGMKVSNLAFLPACRTSDYFLSSSGFWTLDDDEEPF